MIETIKKPTFIRSALVTLIASNFAMSANLYAAEEQEEEAKEENKITVTGSRIKRTDIEGAAPITVITSEDMEKEGFTTAYEALRSLSESTGEVQGEQYTNSFTPNAQMINLRGLGPGYTLVLLNGKRVANYPMPYNGQSNFFNLASIPAAAIEKMEIMSGGASAIYGSDAVAGVINIITKTDVDAITLSARIGSTTQGGGDTSRLQAVGGYNTDKLSWTWAAEYITIDPMFGKDRDWLDSDDDRPGFDPETDVIRPSLDILNYDAITGTFIAPPAGACDQFVGLTLNEDYRGRGFSCGRDDTGDESLRSERERISFYNTFNYDLNSDHSLYGRLLLNRQEARATGFRLWWGSNFPYYNIDTGGYEYLQRVFTPEETGPQSAKFDEDTVDLNIGMTGLIGEFDYDVSLSKSKVTFDRERTRFKEEVALDYFMGPDLRPTLAPDFSYPIHSPNLDNFYTPLTPEVTAQLTGLDDTGSEAEVTSFSASISGDWFEIGDNVTSFAAFVEVNEQSYQINLHPRLLNTDGEGWFGLTGTGGGGERKHNAVGVEFLMPVTDTLNVTLATRYDDYEDLGTSFGGVGGQSTYNLGLEWRPTDELMLRAMAATTFKAPDMHYVFADDSGFYTGIRDYYICRTDDDPTNDADEDCDEPTGSVRGFRGGNKALEAEEGDSYTAGMVWAPNDDFSMSIDWYEITLENVITDSSIDQFLRTNADCLMGIRDQNSAECLQAASFITRNPMDAAVNPGAVISVRTDPINEELLQTEGVDVKLAYGWDTDFGRWTARLDWSHILNAYNSDARDEPEAWRDDMWNFNARSKVRGSISWTKDEWNVTLLGNRLGSLPRWDEEGRIGPSVTYNMTSSYRFNDSSMLSIQIQNLLDRRPPYDDSFTSWPYFYRGQFNAIGREVFLTYTHTFQ